ncbi:MAG TPA: NAD-dependent epimerase/dehydratase family protein [Flavobacterium sp.]
MVLVTGGTGLVGAHLLLHLVENGEVVRAIYRNLGAIQKTKNLFSIYKKEALFEKIDWIQADITDVPNLETVFDNVEYVYHCAAIISFDPKDEDLLRKTNIEGTANIVNFCIAKSVKKLCFVSSIAALGDLKENEKVITEEAEWNPEKSHSDYAISKYGAEMEIWRGQQEGLETVIVNPGVILGPGFWEQGSGLLFKKVSNGLSFYTKGITGFIAVPDVVQIAVKLMKNEYSNERFTLVAENTSFEDLLNTIADSLNVKRPSHHASPLLVNIAYRIDWLLSNILGQKRKLDRATAKSSYTKSYFSNEKIKNTLQTEFLDIHQYIKEISRL